MAKKRVSRQRAASKTPSTKKTAVARHTVVAEVFDKSGTFQVPTSFELVCVTTSPRTPFFVLHGTAEVGDAERKEIGYEAIVWRDGTSSCNPPAQCRLVSSVDLSDNVNSRQYLHLYVSGI